MVKVLVDNHGLVQISQPGVPGMFITGSNVTKVNAMQMGYAATPEQIKDIYLLEKQRDLSPVFPRTQF